jgi:hypothetical protein
VHYTTVVDFAAHWQTLLAGLIALIAAIITVFVTLRVEQRKVDRELDVSPSPQSFDSSFRDRSVRISLSKDSAAGQTDRSRLGWWKACHECPPRSFIRPMPTRSDSSKAMLWMWLSLMDYSTLRVTAQPAS